jgi:hypothetical protein
MRAANGYEKLSPAIAAAGPIDERHRPALMIRMGSRTKWQAAYL